MRRRWLAIAVILTLPSGCDNVKWGGLDVGLRKPPVHAAGASATPPVADSMPAPAHAVLPAGPTLFAGTRAGDSATLVVVGSVAGDSLAAFPSDEAVPGYRAYFTRHLLARGTRLVLFADGVRVGHLTVARTGVDRGYCVARPTVTGLVELVPDAASADRLLALPDSAASRRPYGAYRALQDTYEQRVASLSLVIQAIRSVGAIWPPSLTAARADIETFQLQGAPGPSIAATFLYQDHLSTAAPAGTGAYALFVMGSRQDTTYRSDYVWYRKAQASGKGAPRYFDHLDLAGDGHDEVLLDVFGNGTRWFALLGERKGSWVRTFEDPCATSRKSAGR